MQGIGWMTRKAISWATITLHTKQYVEESKTHIDIEQTATGGVKGTTENRTLDWNERSHSDYMFGDLKGRSEWIAPGSEKWDALEGFMKDGWGES
jgi:hypothetical protein